MTAIGPSSTASIETDPGAAATLEAPHAPSVGAVAAVAAYWDRRGLGAHFGSVADAVFAMVANRLVAPCSKRRVPEWADAEVVMPAWFKPPALARYYRALDAVADMKEVTEGHLYSVLTTLTNLDLRLVCYDATSTYFEGSTRSSVRFQSRVQLSRTALERPGWCSEHFCHSDGLPSPSGVAAHECSPCLCRADSPRGRRLVDLGARRSHPDLGLTT